MNAIFVLVVAVLAVCSAQSVIHEEGTKGGPLMVRGDTGSVSEWRWGSQKKKVRYPADGDFDQDIGYLKITNEMDTDYSTATVKSGGPKNNYVEIEYYAPPLRGYHYNVEIRGKNTE